MVKFTPTPRSNCGPAELWNSSAEGHAGAFAGLTTAPIRSPIYQSGRALVMRGPSQPSAHLGAIFLGLPIRGIHHIDVMEAKPRSKPPHSPEHDGSYPEDQEHADEASVDSSLSIDKMASWIADGVPEPLVDLSGDENEGVDDFGRKDNQHPVQILEPFNARFATSYWPRWDSHGTM